MALDQDEARYEQTDTLDLFNDDYALTLAAGDIHNKFVAEWLDGLPAGFGPQEFAYNVIRVGCTRGALSSKAGKALRATVAAIDLKAKDLGLAELERLRKASIKEEAEFVVIAVQQIAAASISNGLDELAIEGGNTQARRRRLWRIGLLDLAGGAGGFLLGGIGGAIAGAVGASAAAAADS